MTRPTPTALPCGCTSLHRCAEAEALLDTLVGPPSDEGFKAGLDYVAHRAPLLQKPHPAVKIYKESHEQSRP